MNLNSAAEVRLIDVPWRTTNKADSCLKVVYYANIRRMVDVGMLDLGLVDGFDWDAGNARKSVDKHGVSQADAEQIFFNEPLLLISDPKHSQQEPRYHALGATDDRRLLHITFTLRLEKTRIRVISARDMHRKERAFYEQTQNNTP